MAGYITGAGATQERFFTVCRLLLVERYQQNRAEREAEMEGQTLWANVKDSRGNKRNLSGVKLKKEK